jgi:hypothetical protein
VHHREDALKRKPKPKEGPFEKSIHGFGRFEGEKEGNMRLVEEERCLGRMW